MNIDECESSPCRNGAECIDGINKYFCQCLEGFEGPRCQTNINECIKYQPCENGASCVGKLKLSFNAYLLSLFINISTLLHCPLSILLICNCKFLLSHTENNIHHLNNVMLLMVLTFRTSISHIEQALHYKPHTSMFSLDENIVFHKF